MSIGRTAAKPRKASQGGHRYAGASTNPLTTKQKGIIVSIARRAFRHRRIGSDFNAWRRDEQEKAVGHDSLTVCCQADYNMLVSHFEGLAGDGAKEFQAAFRDLGERKRQAEHALVTALEEGGLDISYAATLCRSMYKRDLDDASADQLWKLKYTVDNRRRARAGKPAETSPAGVPTGNPF